MNRKLDLNTLIYLFQLELLIEDIETRNELFSTHKLYDINMPLFYNVSLTIYNHEMNFTP